MADVKPVKKTASWKAGFAAGVLSVLGVGGTVMVADNNATAPTMTITATSAIPAEDRYKPLTYLDSAEAVTVLIKREHGGVFYSKRFVTAGECLPDIGIRFQPSKNPNKGK